MGTHKELYICEIVDEGFFVFSSLKKAKYFALAKYCRWAINNMYMENEHFSLEERQKSIEREQQCLIAFINDTSNAPYIEDIAYIYPAEIDPM